MIKVGFICEGFTERKLLESDNFKSFLTAVSIEITTVINAEGSGNLLPHNIGPFIEILESEGSKIIIILTDLDEDACITLTKKRVNARPNDIVIIAVKAIESWFLACTSSMRKILNDANFEFQFPENESNPFETIRQLKFFKTGRGFNKGTGGKLNLLNNLLLLGLNITEAAQHPNCPSAAYFINKLLLLSTLDQ